MPESCHKYTLPRFLRECANPLNRHDRIADDLPLSRHDPILQARATRDPIAELQFHPSPRLLCVGQ